MATGPDGNYLKLEELGVLQPENYSSDYYTPLSANNICYYSSSYPVKGFTLGYCVKSGSDLIQVLNVQTLKNNMEFHNFPRSTNKYGQTIDVIFSPNLNNEFVFYFPSGDNDPKITSGCACNITDSDGVFPVHSMGVERVRFNITDTPVTGQITSPDGDLQACCFKDGNQSFSDPTKYILQNGDYRSGGIMASGGQFPNLYDTCDFNHRSMGSKQCVTQFQKYCLANLDPDDLYDRWTGNTGINSIPGWNCYNAFKRIVSSDESYKNNNGYNSDGVYAPFPQPVDTSIIQNPSFAINTVQTLFSLTQGKIDISAEQNDPNYSNFTSILYEICSNYHFACKKNLDSYCTNESANSLINNPGNLKWCGCHLPLDEYGKYVDIYGVKKECSPTCHNSVAIPDVQPNVPLKMTDVIGVDYNPVICKGSNVCVIDDINVNISKNLNINQVCGGCGTDASCQCIIENDRFISGGSLDVNQMCGNNSVYYETQYDPLTGNYTYTNVGNEIFRDTEEKLEETNFTIIIVIILFFLGILVVLGYNFGI